MNFIKKSLLIFILCTVFLSIKTNTYAQAQRSQCIVTKVGNPATQPTLPAECAIGSGTSGGANGGTPGGIKPPNYPVDLRGAIIAQFGITMNGYNPTSLKWAWEKLWDISNTKFTTYTRGAFMQATTERFSQQIGCGGPVSIKFFELNDEAFFKYIFTHELGHYIRNCNDRFITKKAEQLNAYQQEGPMSYYAGHTILCGSSLDNGDSEDYAEMVAYYLNPQAGLRALKCDPNPNPPNPFFKLIPRKELHYTVVSQVLQ